MIILLVVCALLAGFGISKIDISNYIDHHKSIITFMVIMIALMLITFLLVKGAKEIDNPDDKSYDYNLNISKREVPNGFDRNFTYVRPLGRKLFGPPPLTPTYKLANE